MTSLLTGVTEPIDIETVAICGSRLLIGLEDSSRVSAADLDQLGTRGWVSVPGGVQLIIGPDVASVAASLSA